MGYFVAAKPPPGYVQETRQAGVLTGLVFVALAIVVPTTARVGLRLQRGSSMQFGWDDWAILVGAIYSLAIGAAAKHVWEVTYEQYGSGMVVAMVCRTTFYVAVGMIKLSIAIFIQRLADRLNSWWRISCNIFIASIVGYMILAIFFNVFACNPPAIQWDLALRGQTEPEPVCIDLGVQAKVLSGIHVAQGLMLLFTPIVILWKVQMQRAKKVRLFAIWTIGGVTVLGGLLRQIRPTMTNDFTWDYVEVLVWTCLDLSLGILAASLPVLDGLLENYWRKTNSTVMNPHRSRQSQSATGARTWLYSKTSDTERNRKSTTRTSMSIIAPVMVRSESSESIVKKGHLQGNKNNGVELSILCTQEVEVHISAAVEEVEKGQEKVRGPRAPSPFYHNRPEWHDKSHRF
ncbi:integral membrane protein [Colletotrichum tofieldiae]|nr:integral membrane protein [Colletotrichum tofieldiae]